VNNRIFPVGLEFLDRSLDGRVDRPHQREVLKTPVIPDVSAVPVEVVGVDGPDHDPGQVLLHREPHLLLDGPGVVVRYHFVPRDGVGRARLGVPEFVPQLRVVLHFHADLVVAHETVLPREGALEAYVFGHRAQLRLASRIRVVRLVEQKSAAVQRHPHHQLLGRRPQFEHVVDRELDVEHVGATQGGVGAGFLVPGAVVVVAHHVDEVEVGRQALDVVGDVDGVLTGTESRRQEQVVLVERRPQLLQPQIREKEKFAGSKLTLTSKRKLSLSSGAPSLFPGNSQSKSRPSKLYFLKRTESRICRDVLKNST
jgi:hypothetical protein